jgi:hypothetical protein
MLLADGQDLCSEPLNKQEPLADSTGGSIPGAIIGYNQGLPASGHGDEISRPLHLHTPAKIEALPVCIPLEPQSNLHPCEVSTAGFRDLSAY